MRIYCTAGQLNEMGLWERYCELTGTSLYAMNEGRLDSSESMAIPEVMWPDLSDRIITPSKG
jgi:hypothetical protein